ncbi:MAG: hypothetical protein AM325_013100 [Candidatus Thorarchaeota archaeon SMTZ1-45]|nr:MAG: hypothetical protein AM325_14760 [Candidatus Thorarchaeota archaeon SMTZ1-45]
MAGSGAARKWVLAGAVLQFFVGSFRTLLGIIFMLDYGIRMNLDPNDPSLPLLGGITSYLFLGALIGLILLLLWFILATNPGRFQKAISVTGIIGMLMSGILPGLLVFNGGRKARSQPEPSLLTTIDNESSRYYKYSVQKFLEVSKIKFLQHSLYYRSFVC